MPQPAPAHRPFELQLAALVEKFERYRAHYLSAAYLEAEVRADFIDLLFEALGWDLGNRAGLGPREREVEREKGDTSGRPDYTFRLDGRTVFFVEAKAPHVALDRANVVMQAKTYAWNSKQASIAVVTDFEEFRLYDATVKPDRQHPEVGLIFAHRYTEYLTPRALDDLWLLSKESVAAGSIDRLLSMSSVKQRQRLPVDQAFLDDLTEWREKLAKAAFKIDPALGVTDLNSVVQVFLDRLIFIRIAEDRGILPARGLEDIIRVWERSGKRRSLVTDLNALFHEVNALLNGEIFRPHLCEKIDWDREAALVARIIAALYDGPYRFDVIGVELLGSIYERYLGKTIKITATRAAVEDKPEVRKAGGVYYTPRYIVDYIVEQTVGQLIEGKSPAQIAKLKILDPACGSGSFLLGAYQTLLDYHARWKAQHQRRSGALPGQARLLLDESVEYGAKLSLEEKAGILKNNLYGVDIDPQAVEITMMSLYIKMLEGERGAIFGQHILPPLRDNIKCGNSLIGHDIREQAGVTDADLDRIKPFDWDSPREGFGEIMKAGGFDAVIGNPPYIQLSMADYFDGNVSDYLSRAHSSSMGRLNTFGLFIEKALSELLGKSGLLSFIVPNTMLTQEYYQALRREMLKFRIDSLTTFRFPVFAGAVVETVVFVVQNASANHNKIQIVEYDNRSMSFQHHEIEQDTYLHSHRTAFLVRADAGTLQLKAKLERSGSLLKVVANINQAIALKYDRSQSLFRQRKAANYKPVLDGRNIQRYALEWGGYYLAYDVEKIHSCKRTDIFEADEKIFFRRVGDRLIATYDDAQFYALNTLVVITLYPTVNVALKYILGLLNSRLMNYYYITFLKSTKKIFSEIQARQLAQLPIRPIDFSDPADRDRHDKMAALVTRMLELHTQHRTAASESTRTRLEREIHITDEKIDARVYELYGLSEQEIGIVEGASQPRQSDH